MTTRIIHCIIISELSLNKQKPDRIHVLCCKLIRLENYQYSPYTCTHGAPPSRVNMYQPANQASQEETVRQGSSESFHGAAMKATEALLVILSIAACSATAVHSGGEGHVRSVGVSDGKQYIRPRTARIADASCVCTAQYDPVCCTFLTTAPAVASNACRCLCAGGAPS